MEAIKDLQSFYKRHFDMYCDFSNVKMPESKVGYRHIVMADVPFEQLRDKFVKLFNLWLPEQKKLDRLVAKSDRHAQNGSYAILMRDEPDDDLGGLSPKEVSMVGVLTATLTEGMIHALKFFDETGLQLDHNRIAFCAGSRFNDDSIPGIGWVTSLICDGQMRIGLHDPIRKNDRACYRRVFVA